MKHDSEKSKKAERKMLKKAQESTNPAYGKNPPERTLPEKLLAGVINLDKPSGPTSHQVAAWAREILHVEKAGHGGTLDPNVTGVLPIALNNAAKAVGALHYGGKEYVCVGRFHKDIEEKRLRNVFSKFVGEIYQTPPVRSAVKRVLRIRRVHYIDVIEIKERDVLFRVGCEAGTYIRTLINDIGIIYGGGAHMQELRRTRAATLSEENAHTLHALKDAYVAWKEDGDETALSSMILPTEILLEPLPKLIIRDSAVDALCHGAKLAVPGILEVEESIVKDTVLAIFTQKGEAVAIAKAVMSAEEMIGLKEGFAADTKRVLMEPGTYPMMWKKSEKSEEKK